MAPSPSEGRFSQTRCHGSLRLVWLPLSCSPGLRHGQHFKGEFPMTAWEEGAAPDARKGSQVIASDPMPHTACAPTTLPSMVPCREPQPCASLSAVPQLLAPQLASFYAYWAPAALLTLGWAPGFCPKWAWVQGATGTPGQVGWGAGPSLSACCWGSCAVGGVWA